MASRKPALTLGIEEEYLLVDPETRALASRPPAGFMRRCEEALGPQVTHEFLQSQVEVGTSVCRLGRRGPQGTGASPKHRRDVRARVRPPHDRVLHPPLGELDRAGAGRARALPHPHPGASVPRPPHGHLRHARPCRHRGRGSAHRSDEPGDVFPAPPAGAEHVLAVLGGTGYRHQGVSADHLRRPATLRRAGDVRQLQRLERDAADAPGDRPVRRRHQDLVGPAPERPHPTLEMRICDVCTKLDDAITIAAFYQAILAFLYHLRANNQTWRKYRRILVAENKWRAQRYGLQGTLADFGQRKLVPCTDLIDELIGLLRDAGAGPRLPRPARAGARDHPRRHQCRPPAPGLSCRARGGGERARGAGQGRRLAHRGLARGRLCLS